MHIRNLFLFALVFCVTGELLVRLDMRFDVMNKAPNIIAVEMEESKEKRLVDAGVFRADEPVFKVLVVGDSYIYGGGIDPEKKFSNSLRKLLSEANQEEALVLDISRPSNNTLDNFNYFDHYFGLFRPNVVVWAYNINDILGGLEPKANEGKEPENGAPEQTAKKVSSFKRFVKTAYKCSEMLRFVSANLQKELKLRGIVLPAGDFYRLTHILYQPEHPEWKRSKELLARTAQMCQENQSLFILYKMPEFNLLNNNSLFSQIDERLVELSGELADVEYMDGYDNFGDSSAGEYRLSKYDGHPNEAAHRKIADRVFETVVKQRQSLEDR